MVRQFYSGEYVLFFFLFKLITSPAVTLNSHLLCKMKRGIGERESEGTSYHPYRLVLALHGWDCPHCSRITTDGERNSAFTSLSQLSINTECPQVTNWHWRAHSVKSITEHKGQCNHSITYSPHTNQWRPMPEQIIGLMVSLWREVNWNGLYVFSYYKSFFNRVKELKSKRVSSSSYLIYLVQTSLFL